MNKYWNNIRIRHASQQESKAVCTKQKNIRHFSILSKKQSTWHMYNMFKEINKKSVKMEKIIKRIVYILFLECKHLWKPIYSVCPRTFEAFLLSTLSLEKTTVVFRRNGINLVFVVLRSFSRWFVNRMEFQNPNFQDSIKQNLVYNSALKTVIEKLKRYFTS